MTARSDAVTAAARSDAVTGVARSDAVTGAARSNAIRRQRRREMLSKNNYVVISILHDTTLYAFSLNGKCFTFPCLL